MVKYLSEFIGTFFLLVIVVGSGIMGEQLSNGNVAIALLANSIATGCGLFAIINVFGAVSGAHFNPLVTIIDFFSKKMTATETGKYILAQLSGAITGVIATHIMFSHELIILSVKNRTQLPLFFSEFIATFGLILVIRFTAHFNKSNVALCVGAYIASAYWFTSSTSFANPVVTIARSFTNTFSGIHYSGILGFIVAQIIGATLAELFYRQVINQKVN